MARAAVFHEHKCIRCGDKYDMLVLETDFVCDSCLNLTPTRGTDRDTDRHRLSHPNHDRMFGHNPILD